MDIIDILVVEDNDADAEICLRTLKKTGLSNLIYCVKDGLQALDFLFATTTFAYRKVENIPKLIILDLNMPHIDGLSVLKVIRGDDRTRMIPVVVLTASSEKEDEEKCKALNVSRFIQKPVDSAEFSKIIEEIGRQWLSADKTNH